MRGNASYNNRKWPSWHVRHCWKWGAWMWRDVVCGAVLIMALAFSSCTYTGQISPTRSIAAGNTLGASTHYFLDPSLSNALLQADCGTNTARLDMKQSIADTIRQTFLSAFPGSTEGPPDAPYSFSLTRAYASIGMTPQLFGVHGDVTVELRVGFKSPTHQTEIAATGRAQGDLGGGCSKSTALLDQAANDALARLSIELRDQLSR
jgi:hypothetical protein